MKLVFEKLVLHKQYLHSFLHALHCRECPVPLLTAVSCVKIRPENTEMKLVFMLLVSDITSLLPGELKHNL
jgi:hypothetical protein